MTNNKLSIEDHDVNTLYGNLFTLLHDYDNNVRNSEVSSVPVKISTGGSVLGVLEPQVD